MNPDLNTPESILFDFYQANRQYEGRGTAKKHEAKEAWKSSLDEATAQLQQLVQKEVRKELEALAEIVPTEPPKIDGLTVFDTGKIYQQVLKKRIKELEQKGGVS